MQMKLCLIGLGYWGPNLARNLDRLGVLYAMVDKDLGRLDFFEDTYRNVCLSDDYKDFINDVDGFVIATPPDTHYNIAKELLLAGKHVFVEKPLTLDLESANDLVKIADELGKVLMVGHTFLYSPDIMKVKDLVNSDDFGDIYYMYTKRLNLGKIQKPANVIEDLAPHDISIFNYISGKKCTEVQTFSHSCVLGDHAEVAFINLKYGNSFVAHLHLSWLDPLKVRETVVVGSNQMIVCDSGSKEVYVHNKGVDIDKRARVSNKDYAHHLLTYRYGDMVMPYIESAEPLFSELSDFIDSIQSSKSPISDGSFGAEVVSVMEAAQKSLREGGSWVKVQS